MSDEVLEVPDSENLDPFDPFSAAEIAAQSVLEQDRAKRCNVKLWENTCKNSARPWRYLRNGLKVFEQVQWQILVETCVWFDRFFKKVESYYMTATLSANPSLLQQTQHARPWCILMYFGVIRAQNWQQWEIVRVYCWLHEKSTCSHSIPLTVMEFQVLVGEMKMCFVRIALSTLLPSAKSAKMCKQNQTLPPGLKMMKMNEMARVVRRSFEAFRVVARVSSHLASPINPQVTTLGRSAFRALADSCKLIDSDLIFEVYY